MKCFLKEGSCEPASGKDNSLPDCCEGVGVLLSEGGNTSAYLATERYRSMSIHPSACHSQNRLVPVRVSDNGTTENVFLHPVSVGSYSSLYFLNEGLSNTILSTISFSLSAILSPYNLRICCGTRLVVMNEKPRFSYLLASRSVSGLCMLPNSCTSTGYMPMSSMPSISISHSRRNSV